MTSGERSARGLAAARNRTNHCTSHQRRRLAVELLEMRAMLAHTFPIGNPSAVNGWSTTSAVSISDYSGERDTSGAATGVGNRKVVNLINGSGISGANGELHSPGPAAGTEGMFAHLAGGAGDSGTFGMPGVFGTPNPGTLQGAGSHWIELQFDQIYKLDEVAIWNDNQPVFYAQGWKHLAIQVSQTGGSNAAEWTTVYNGLLPLSAGAGNSTTLASLVLPLGGVSARYITLINTGSIAGDEANWRSGTFDDHAALSEIRFTARDGDWQDAALQAVLANGSLQAKLQAGLIYELKDLLSGDILLSINPAQIAAVQPIFGTTQVNLSTASVAQTASSTLVTTTYTWSNGTVWHISWSIDGSDLVLQTSAQTPTAVPMFSYIIENTDIANHTLVTVDVNGVAHEMDAPFSGTQFGGNDKASMPLTLVQPLVGLFQEDDAGWFVEGRDLNAGPSNLRAFGEGQTADLVISRAYMHQPTQNPTLYEVRIRTYQDEWQDAVDPYIAWMQNEVGFVPLDQKPQTWVNGIRSQVYITPGDYATLAAIAQRLNPAETYIGRQAEYRNFGFDIGYPDYTVTPTAAAWIAQARSLGFHLGAHVNVGGIDRSNTALIQQMQPGLLQIGTDGQGNPIYDGTSTFVYVSAAYQPWRDYLVNAISGVVASGVEVIYLDQTNGVLGKYFINGITGTQGVMLLEQAIQAAYPNVVIQTEQFNPMSSRHAAFALTTLQLGHPLSGYIFSPFIKIVPEGLNYQPTDVDWLDAFARWGHFTPGAGGSIPEESWLQIAGAFQQFDLRPNSRLARNANQVSGFSGPNGVTAFFEQTATTRSFVVYEPGKSPKVFGLRYTNVTQVSATGGLKDWLIYDGNTLKGLDPSQTYFVDPAVAMAPDRFHLTSIPADYHGFSNLNRLVVTQEMGFDDRWFRVTFTGNGQINMVVPDNYDVYLDGVIVPVNRATDSASITVAAGIGNPSEILAFRNDSNGLLVGALAGLPWHVATHKAPRSLFDNQSSEFPPDGFFTIIAGSGVWIGQLPAASSIHIQGAFQMRDESWMGSVADAVIRINGVEVMRLNPGSGPPFPLRSFDIDVTQFAGQEVFIELIADGDRLTPDKADWIAPRIVVGELSAIGNPSAANHWSTTSAVTVQSHSGQAVGREIVNLVNGSGISGEFGQYHAAGNPVNQMGLFRGNTPSSATANTLVGSHWVQLRFDKVYSLGEAWLWNWNETPYSQFGWKHIAVQYSVDGINFQTAFVGQIPQAPATAGATPDLLIDFGGVSAKYVVLTNTGFGTNENWSNGQFTNDAGLSEVRFFKRGTPIRGDFDGDNDVDLTDYGILTSHWLQTVTANANGDLDGNGLVDLRDFGAFKQEYSAFNGAGGGSGAEASSDPAQQSESIPGVAINDNDTTTAQDSPENASASTESTKSAAEMMLANTSTSEIEQVSAPSGGDIPGSGVTGLDRRPPTQHPLALHYSANSVEIYGIDLPVEKRAFEARSNVAVWDLALQSLAAVARPSNFEDLLPDPAIVASPVRTLTGRVSEATQESPSLLRPRPKSKAFDQAIAEMEPIYDQIVGIGRSMPRRWRTKQP